MDTISDFSQGDGDITDLSGLGSLSFIDTASFTGSAGELRYEVVGSNTFVFADIDGDTVADFEIKITGSLALVTSDFIP